MTLIEHDPHLCTRVPCGRCRPHIGGAPPIPPDPHQTQAPPAPPDATVRSIGLPRHPALPSIAETDVALSERLLSDGETVLEYASILASRGYSASTLGDGGARSTDGTSSTERNAGVTQEVKPKDIKHNRWVGVDVTLAGLLRDHDRTRAALDSLMADVLHHAADHDHVPAGTGECVACGRFCRPTKEKPGNRIQAWFCPTCYRAWARAGRPERSTWIHTRQQFLTDDQGVLHTPEPDLDLDLSREIPA